MTIKFTPTTTHAAGHRATIDGQELSGLGPGQLASSLIPLHGEMAQTLVRAIDPATNQVVERVVSTSSVVS
jgi:hypothetical protein